MLVWIWQIGVFGLSGAWLASGRRESYKMQMDISDTVGSLCFKHKYRKGKFYNKSFYKVKKFRRHTNSKKPHTHYIPPRDKYNLTQFISPQPPIPSHAQSEIIRCGATNTTLHTAYTVAPFDRSHYTAPDSNDKHVYYDQNRGGRSWVLTWRVCDKVIYVYTHIEWWRGGDPL